MYALPMAQNVLNFMQFLGNFGKIVCCTPSPPTGNPGPALVHWTSESYVQYYKQNLDLKEPDCFFAYVHTSIECRIFLHTNNSSLYSINCTSSCLQGFPSCVCRISYSFFVSTTTVTNKISSKISKWVRNFK